MAMTTAAAAAAVLVGWMGFRCSADRPLSAAEQMARALAFNQAVPLVLAAVPASQRPAALQGMKLPANQQAELEQQQAELVHLTLWDDMAEDGDVVTIDCDGFRQSVTLKHAPVTIAIPRPRTGLMSLTGVFDGGGGITVAVSSGAGRVPLPWLSVGQSVGVPVR